MKVMICQNCSGQTNVQSKKERDEVERRLKAKGFEIMDKVPYEEFLNTPKDVKNVAVYDLGKVIALLGKADVVYFMKGWENTRSCRIKHAICREYCIPTMYDMEVEG